MLQALVAGAWFAAAAGTVPASPQDRVPVSGSAAWAKACFWEQHLIEVITGQRPMAHAAGASNPDYDLRATTLAQREAAKAAELSRMPWPGRVSARTVRRKRLSYQEQGLGGLVDGRAGRTEANGARVNPVILQLLYNQALERRRGQTSVTLLRRILVDEVERRHPELVDAVPSVSTIRRIVSKAMAAPKPHRPQAWGLGAGRERLLPDGRAQVTSILFDLRAPGGGVVPQQLTVAMDAATSRLLAAVVHLPSSLPDGPALLVRMCTPRVLLPGAEAASDPAALEQPFVRPRQLLLEPGPLARSAALRSACRALGLGLQVRALGPLDKGEVERHGKRLRQALEAALSEEDFWRRLPQQGDSEAVWVAVQRFVDEWIPGVWQPAPARGAVVPSDQRGRRQRRGGMRYADVPYPPQATLPLLPSMWRQVTRRGVQVGGQRYDGAVLDSLRGLPRQDGAVQAGRVRVHVDSTDPERVWLRLPHQGWAAVPRVGEAPGPRSGPRPMEPRTHIANVVAGSTSSGTVFQAASWADLVRSGQRTDREGDFWGPPGSDGYRARLDYHAQLAVLDSPLVAAVRERAQALLVMNAQPRDPGGPRHMLLVTGVPGIGKTTALREVARSVEQRERTQDPERPDLTASLYTPVRPGSSARQYLADTLQFLGLSRSRHSTWQLCDLLRDELLRRGTKVVIVDDAHALGRRSGGGDLEVLRHLADQVPALFMVAAVELDLSGAQQVAARFEHVRGGPVPPGPEWERLVRDLEDQLRLRHFRSGGLVQQADYLHARTRGVVGGLVRLVARAAVEAIQDGSEDILGRLAERRLV
nr:AAA family ATPase [Streptomyces sp. 846.5]